jgi:PAS domain S-box-containing protein
MNMTININDLPRRALIIFGIVAIPVLGFVDYHTGPEISFSIFYLLPISLLTWLSGWGIGAATALFSAIAWLMAELFWEVSYSQSAIPYWNATTRLGLFFIVVLLLSKLRTQKQGLETRVERGTASLRESEAHFRAIFEQAAVGIAEINAADGRWLRVNQKFCETVGYSEAELLGRLFQEITHSEDVEVDLNFRRRILSGELQTYSREKQYVHKNGSLIWGNVTVSLVQGPLGTPEYFIVIIRDISDRKQAEEQIQRQVKRLNALHMIDLAISTSFDLQITLDTVLQQVLVQLGVDASAILLFNPYLQVLDYAASRGFQSHTLQHLQRTLDEGYAGKVVLQHKTIHIAGAADSGEPAVDLQFPDESFVEYFGVPLTIKGEIKGVLEIYHRSPLDADLEWLNFLETLAGQTAIAIDSAQLFDSLERSNLDLRLAYDATIEGWSRAMDLRDKETEGHAQRVTAMTLELARAMEINQHQIIHISRGALLHDMGKLGIPDNILLKSARLTDEEWEIMHKHPQFAYDMLSDIYYLKPALDIPYCHHEKWDGTGYPRGLKGEEIPLPARIFAIADVWDALTSDRPYRKAWSDKQALDYILEQSGKHFDPRVVKAFLEMMQPANLDYLTPFKRN